MRINILTIALAASLGVVLVLPVSSFFFFVPAYHFMLTSISEEESLRVTEHLAENIHTDGNPVDRSTLTPEDCQEIKKVAEDFDIVKLRLFSDKGEIVFSTDPHEIGTIFSKEYFFRVIATGQSLTRSVKKGATSLEGQTQKTDVMETYVPIMKGGRFLGAFEIYYNLSVRKDKYGWVINRYIYTVFAATFILVAAVLVIAGKARGYLQKRNRAEEALRLAHDELEVRVTERTAELHQANEELVKEITKRRIFEQELRLAAKVIDNVIEGICVTDTSGTIERVNRRFTEITGYSPKEAVGDNPRILKSDRHEPEFYEEMWRSLKETGKWHGEIWNRRRNGEIYREWLSISSIKNTKNRTSHYVGVFYDVKHLLEQQEKLSRKAFHDALTNLPNRELFHDRLDMALTQAGRRDQRLAVLFIDLDDFKAINDTLGHHFGDVFLQKVAERLTACCRGEDTVARMGGDEFVLIVTNIMGEGDVLTVMERIFSELAKPITYRGETMQIKASIGGALYPDDAEEHADLINKADKAMYAAKQKGKNTFILSSHMEG